MRGPVLHSFSRAALAAAAASSTAAAAVIFSGSSLPDAGSAAEGQLSAGRPGATSVSASASAARAAAQRSKDACLHALDLDLHATMPDKAVPSDLLLQGSSGGLAFPAGGAAERCDDDGGAAGGFLRRLLERALVVHADSAKPSSSSAHYGYQAEDGAAATRMQQLQHLHADAQASVCTRACMHAYRRMQLGACGQSMVAPPLSGPGRQQ